MWVFSFLCFLFLCEYASSMNVPLPGNDININNTNSSNNTVSLSVPTISDASPSVKLVPGQMMRFPLIFSDVLSLLSSTLSSSSLSLDAFLSERIYVTGDPTGETIIANNGAFGRKDSTPVILAKLAVIRDPGGLEGGGSDQ